MSCDYSSFVCKCPRAHHSTFGPWFTGIGAVAVVYKLILCRRKRLKPCPVRDRASDYLIPALARGRTWDECRALHRRISASFSPIHCIYRRLCVKLRGSGRTLVGFSPSHDGRERAFPRRSRGCRFGHPCHNGKRQGPTCSHHGRAPPTHRWIRSTI